MTRVRLARDGARWKLAADGHADGNPSVCAAVSGLLYAMAGYLANDFPDGVWELEPGRARLAAGGAAEVFALVRIGLLQIARRYPDCISVEEVDYEGFDTVGSTAGPV